MSRSLLTLALLAGLLNQPAAGAMSDGGAAGPAAAAFDAHLAATDDPVSLGDAIRQVRNEYGDVTILKAETREKNGRRVHRIKFLTDAGRVRTVEVNAGTGKSR
jgi:uncharacterized membrane protein YkoI